MPISSEKRMPESAIYVGRRIRANCRPGVTQPHSSSLSCVTKFDSAESPRCTFNEAVAVRLAQTFHIPVADGVLVAAGAGMAFSSLELGAPNIGLHQGAGRYDDIARRYPHAAAALVAFDILVGNTDRGGNIIASLASPHFNLCRGIDHSHALLGIEVSPTDALERLASYDLIVRHHPFFGLIDEVLLQTWVHRLSTLPSYYLRECCEFGRPVGMVSPELQAEVADALVSRQANLPEIVRRHEDVVYAARRRAGGPP
jgi:hypothetical protein